MKTNFIESRRFSIEPFGYYQKSVYLFPLFGLDAARHPYFYY